MKPNMIRTQIQLSETQAAALKELAARTGVSIAELVRRGVDQLLAGEHRLGSDERRQRAIAAVGRFASGRRDVSEAHDRYLGEAYRR